MTAVVLHLSDVHIKTSADLVLKRATHIAACVYARLPAASHVFIVVSGDIAFSGTEAELALALTFLRTVRTEIEKESRCPVSFISVPGNHDCDFSKNDGTRKMLIKSIEEHGSAEIDDSVIAACTAIQEPFFAFRADLEAGSSATDDKLWRSTRVEVEGKVIAFDALNISWVSKLREEPGRLVFPIQRYERMQHEPADLRIVVMHHPFNWFSQSMYRPFRKYIRDIADIVITGHEHLGNVGLVHDAETHASAFVEGCVLQEEPHIATSSFNVVVLDLQGGQFAATRYQWSGERYQACEEGSWSDYRPLPAKRNSLFAIEKAFQELMDDPGGFFKHPGRAKITLSDIYIYPDLCKVGGTDSKRRTFVSADTLLSPEVTADGILIEGEEKAGCTSLLYQLYRQYHDRGYLPVFVKGKALRKASDAEIDGCIRRAVENQYGKAQVGLFDQIPRGRKLMLVDNLDDSPLQAADARAALLTGLRKRFSHMVVTIGEMFELKDLLDGDKSPEVQTLKHYKLQSFGYAKRSQLIERWMSLGADGTDDEATFIARCDHAEQTINGVMSKGVVPSLPLYLLTLLQSMEAGRTGEFKESALGHYYQFLLTEAFQESGVKPNKLTEHFQYAGQLAWEFHRLQKRELSEAELREFNAKFCQTWHTVDFTQRLEILLRARVLVKAGDDYAFRYPYIYYYLKGQYLSENLADLAVRNYIDHCCRHLYVRDHANSVLFLAHHTNDEFVLNSIVDALRTLFEHCVPVTFNSDTVGVEKLIRDAPKLTYSGGQPKEHRRRRNALIDEFDDGGDGLVDQEETSSKLSLLAQITMLFRTTEILGQVLKNQYSKIQRARKSELIEDLFSGPLRALRDFYDFFERNPDGMLHEIEAALQRKGKITDDEERRTIARKAVAGLVQLLSYGFVMRAARNANSESLLEDVRAVVKCNGKLAFKLIELCIHVDSPKPIPRHMLKEVQKEIGEHMVAQRVLRIMVLNRLYMFKTTEKDMQWLSEELRFDIGMQHNIAYQEQKRRIL